MNRKRVGLALSGGSARGAAHVGILEVLEREGIPVDCIAGVSAGSVVGASYAAGLRAARLLELARGLRWRHVARPVVSRHGVVSFGPLETYLARLLGDLTFDQLPIPFAATAFDLETGEVVLLREGRVATAVHASCAIPGIVTPVVLGGRLLADGGAVNNLPISAVRALGADVVIAVNLSAPLSRKPHNQREIIMATFDALLLHAGDDPRLADVYIPVPLHGLGSLVRLAHTRRAVELGRQAAEQALPAIRAALGPEV